MFLNILSLILLILGAWQFIKTYSHRNNVPLPPKGKYKVKNKIKYNNILKSQKYIYAIFTISVGTLIFFTHDIRLLLLMCIPPIIAFILNLLAINKKYIIFY